MTAPVTIPEPVQQHTQQHTQQQPNSHAPAPAPAQGDVPAVPGSYDVKPVIEDIINDTLPQESPYAVPMFKQYAYTPRKLRVITVGAGFSGLIMAHKFQHRFPEVQEYVEHTIFEARNDIGGTWLVNTYPGVQCDVPSHIYAFPFDPNPDWSKFYSSGPEIQQYIKRTVDKWNLDRDIQLNTKVTEARWLEKQGQWKVTVESDGKTREEICDILISAQGVLV